MKKILLNTRIQKLFLPLTFVCILPVWIMLRRGTSPLPFVGKLLLTLAVVFFLLNLFFKPWEMERAEAKRKKSEQFTQQQLENENDNDGTEQ